MNNPLFNDAAQAARTAFVLCNRVDFDVAILQAQESMVGHPLIVAKLERSIGEFPTMEALDTISDAMMDVCLLEATHHGYA